MPFLAVLFCLCLCRTYMSLRFVRLVGWFLPPLRATFLPLPARTCFSCTFLPTIYLCRVVDIVGASVW
jgi:hypothetical protein